MSTGYVGPGGQWVSMTDVAQNSNGNPDVDLGTTLSGELQQFNRLAGGSASPYVNLTATGVVAAAPCIIYGYTVTVAMSAAATTVYDNASAASGTVLFVIPASTAVGNYPLPGGMIATNGAYASFAGTGTVNFMRVLSA